MTLLSSPHWARPAVTTVVAGVMVAFAFAIALRTTAGLAWPCEMDFFRDMGGAQAILDGYAGSDPAYLDETNWFNPLQPTVFAALAAVTGLPLPTLYATCGPFVNLLGPVALFLLARQLMGGAAALAALAGYLFLGNPTVPSWFQATYSPWAWPMDFAQGFFFLTVAVFVHALKTGRPLWDVVTGLLLGVTFLAHAAPTLVFVGMLVLFTLFSRRGERLRAMQRLLTVGTVSLLVAAPFLLPLVIKYHLHVLNHGPSEHEPIGLGFALRNLVSFRAAVAALGLGALWLWRSSGPFRADAFESAQDSRLPRRVLTALLLSASLLFGYGLLAQALQHRDLANLPRMLPTYHFHLYVKAAESLLFGAGLVAAVGIIATAWRKLAPEANLMANGVFACLLAAIVAVFLPGYVDGIEFVKFRQESERIAAQGDRIALYGWLRQQTKPTDVFLTDMNTAVFTVSAADRKVVCMGDQYSNIYVNYERRADDVGRLYAALRTGDQDGFETLAAKYRLTHVILATAAPDGYAVSPDCLASSRFALVYAQDAYRVYGLKKPSRGH